MRTSSILARMVRLSRTAREAVRRRGDASSPAPRPVPRADDAGRTHRSRTAPGAQGHGAHPGDFTGRVRPAYSPHPDGAPDPGEVVWTWVPYEEDASRGKDRPVLLVGHDGPWLLGLMLSTRDHDARPDARSGQWVDVGPGAWDSQGRPSEVRVDRVLRIDPEAVRREGAVLDRTRFDEVARSLR